MKAAFIPQPTLLLVVADAAIIEDVVVALVLVEVLEDQGRQVVVAQEHLVSQIQMKDRCANSENVLVTQFMTAGIDPTRSMFHPVMVAQG